MVVINIEGEDYKVSPYNSPTSFVVNHWSGFHCVALNVNNQWVSTVHDVLAKYIPLELIGKAIEEKFNLAIRE